jgi:hypothetical protein
MSEILFNYHKVDPTTWAYLSSLLMIGLFFKFNRFWSVRNLDLVLLILLAPGLLMVHYGSSAAKPSARAAAVAAERAQAEAARAAPDSSETPADATPAEPRVDWVVYYGYLWLFGVSGLLLVRLLLDPTMVRRPLLEPNLTSGGLLFIGCSLFLFLMANVLTSELSAEDLKGPQGAEAILARHDTSTGPRHVEDYRRFGPGFYLLNLLPSIPTMPFVSDNADQARVAYAPAARAMAILSHLAVVIAIVVVGYWHFENIKMGIGAAMLYLMLPYTAQMTGQVDHVLPAALLMWAIVFYRKPGVAGTLIGLAMGVVYYPLFLLPLWISFYWQRGVVRFLIGVVAALAVTALSLAFVSEDLASYWTKIRQMFGLFLPNMDAAQLHGIWESRFGWDPVYRLPVIALCVALAGSLAIWPAQKNLGTLLSCSAAVMVAVQFWHGYGGGLYLAWYMPLLLLTIFRPNLEDRIALTVLGESWFLRRRNRVGQFGRAAA